MVEHGLGSLDSGLHYAAGRWSMTRKLAAEVVLDIGSAHGEGPVWHRADQRLDWVDIGAVSLTWTNKLSLPFTHSANANGVD